MSVTIDSLLLETRSFAPSDTFRAQANAGDPDIYAQADADHEGWWEGWAKTLTWFEPWHTV